jgi:hypothetical protein
MVTAPEIPQLDQVPWSELGPYFIETWGHDDQGRMKAESIEIAGQTGSGKSYAEGTILQQRAARWDTAEIVVLTKESDDSIPLLGWPVASTIAEMRKYRQSVYWPQTSATGDARETCHEQRIYELLSALWVKDSNVVIAFDEIGYIESLRGPRNNPQRLKKMIRMYWREARSHNISMIAMKQRPVGVARDQHSESKWKLVFPPAHYADMETFAELLGPQRAWTPVLESLDQEQRQFVIKHSTSGEAYISWIDQELKPLPEQQRQKPRGARETLFGRAKTPEESTDG